MLKYSEQDIINGCRNNDPACQEYLYKQYYSLFLKVCARYAKSMEDAEQLLNDGFFKIFSNIKTYKEAGSFEGWMKRIMVNTCLDYLKSKYVKTAIHTDVNTDRLPESKVWVDNSGLNNIEFKELVSTIQSLPPMTRTVFNLFVFDDFSHKQIAVLLNISVGTSYWHVNQARILLQKKIASNKNPIYGYK